MLFRADQSGVFDHCAGEGPVDFARRAGAKGTGQRGQIYLRPDLHLKPRTKGDRFIWGLTYI